MGCTSYVATSQVSGTVLDVARTMQRISRGFLSMRRSKTTIQIVVYLSWSSCFNYSGTNTCSICWEGNPLIFMCLGCPGNGGDVRVPHCVLLLPRPLSNRCAQGQ